MNSIDESRAIGLPGPILIIGASGFIGANLFRCFQTVRKDVYGTSSRPRPWRLSEVAEEQIKVVDLLVDSQVDNLLEEVSPKTVFNCAAYGAYSFQVNVDLIYRTNFLFVVDLLEKLIPIGIHAFVQAGTSSEYGRNAAAPGENVAPTPNSHYAVSKAAAANAVSFMGKERGVPCVNLRIYSAYGPLEDSSRLIPRLVIEANKGRLPDFVDPQISRDFVYIDDVVDACVEVSGNLRPLYFGWSFNVGTGSCTTIEDLANLARKEFQIEQEPTFKMPNREWDVTDWYANPEQLLDAFNWRARTDLVSGLRNTRDWYESLSDFERNNYIESTKINVEPDSRYSVSVVVACYKDSQAIPVMHERLLKVFHRLRINYEIIFVNDASPDDSEKVILEFTRSDHRVIGISHSRNFGSQAAFRSGMEIATKNAVVLLDGDLQDPPELIEQFVREWRAGYDVVFGRRVGREAVWYMRFAYKTFYRLFDRMSFIQVPHDAGDFSLLDARVVRHLLSFPEREIFLRGLRAFVGFKQIGVNYIRPERMFGQSTNSIIKNIGWARKGIFSFSYMPLRILTGFSIGLLLIAMALMVYQFFGKLFFPESTPKGITTLLVINLGFGSIILFAIGLLGEYISTIFEEVKKRPHFIRKSILRDGEMREL